MLERKSELNMRRIVFLSSLLLLIATTQASAAGYYGRFWRGEEKKAYPQLRNYCDDRASDCFLELVNRWLIPATSSYAAQDALVAYAPVLMPLALKPRYADEIALILYRSEAEYRQLRSDATNLEASSYSPLHDDLFEMGLKDTPASSRSLIPVAYQPPGFQLQGPLQEISLDLFGDATDLIHAKGQFVLIEKDKLSSAELLKHSQAYFESLQKNRQSQSIRAVYALLTPDYLMLYHFIDPQQDFKALDQLRREAGLHDSWHTPLQSIKPIQTRPLLYERIGYGEGANLWFEPGQKPGQADHHRLHPQTGK